MFVVLLEVGSLEKELFSCFLLVCSFRWCEKVSWHLNSLRNELMSCCFLIVDLLIVIWSTDWCSNDCMIVFAYIGCFFSFFMPWKGEMMHCSLLIDWYKRVISDEINQKVVFCLVIVWCCGKVSYCTVILYLLIVWWRASIWIRWRLFSSNYRPMAWRYFDSFVTDEPLFFLCWSLNGVTNWADSLQSSDWRSSDDVIGFECDGELIDELCFELLIFWWYSKARRCTLVFWAIIFWWYTTSRADAL